MYTERPTTNEKKKNWKQKETQLSPIEATASTTENEKKKSSCLFTRSHEQAGGVSHRERQRGITAGCKKQ